MLRVMFVKKKLFVSHWKKNQFFESVKRVQFVESYSTKKSSILRVLSEKGVQFFESYQKEFNSLSHIRKKEFNSFSHFFFEKKKGSILWVIFKKVQFCESNSKKKSILWIITLFLNGFNSSSEIKKGSFLWVMVLLIKKFQFYESYSKIKRFNSLRHIQEIRGSIRCVIFKK